MSVPTKYQIIQHEGEPAYVLVPYTEFELISPMLKAAELQENIPQEVVEAHILHNHSMIRAWREYLDRASE